MPTTTTAAVVESAGAAFALSEVVLDDLRPDEVRVRVTAAGVCHTELGVAAGHLPFPLPGVLGHEGAGIVEEVGAAVTGVAAGDQVLLSYTSCGRCANCRGGHPAYCDTWLPSMQHVALEGRCFVLTACQFLRKSDFPPGVRVSLGDTPDAVLMRGGSAIVSPLGRVLAGPHFGEETILAADLDLDDIGRGKFDFDVVGHYSRPDVFKLVVNEAPQPPVVARRGDGAA